MKRVLRNSIAVMRHSFVLSVVGILVTAIFGIAIPASSWLLQGVIDSVMSFFSQFKQENFSTVVFWTVAFLLIRLLTSVENDIQHGLSAKISMQVKRKLAPLYNDKIKKLQSRLLEDADTQNLLSQVGPDPEGTLVQTHFELLALIGVGISLLGMFTLFLQVAWWVLLGAIVLAIPVFLVNKRALSETHQNAIDTRLEERKAEYISDLMTGRGSNKEVRLFGLNGYLNSKWKVIKQHLRKIRGAMLKQQDKRSYILGALEMAFKLFCIGMFTWQLIRKELTISQYVVLIGALQTIYNFITSHIPGLMMALGYRALSLNLFDQLLNLPEQNFPAAPISIEDIRFENVGFAYPNQKKCVLQSVSFEIRRDERIALVGVNGAGKSTIIKLLLGIYSPTSGRILINGMDCTQSMDAFQHNIATVFQDFMPYALSLRENIAFGRSEEIGNSTALKNSVQVINLKLPNVELDDRLGKEFDQGTDLSYGQWQRLSISRALFAERDILILDEPTSALDPIVERDLYFATASAMKGKTTLIVSHRLGYARFADRILVLDEGTIREEGSHESLITIENGLYRTMFAKQAAWYKEG